MIFIEALLAIAAAVAALGAAVQGEKKRWPWAGFLVAVSAVMLTIIVHIHGTTVLVERERSALNQVADIADVLSKSSRSLASNASEKVMGADGVLTTQPAFGNVEFRDRMQAVALQLDTLRFIYALNYEQLRNMNTEISNLCWGPESADLQNNLPIVTVTKQGNIDLVPQARRLVELAELARYIARQRAQELSLWNAILGR